MLCAGYTDPRLAAVYDSANPWADHCDFHLELAGDVPKRVLDMGCGTGRLACALAARGHEVTGADPSPGMLGVARGRPEGKGVRWIATDAAGLSLDTRFDHAIMTGHVFQVFLTDEEIRAALGNLRRHLAPGGRLAFETRNPAVQDWETWLPEATRETVEVPGVGEVEVHYDIAAAEGALVTYETHFRFAADDVRVASDTLRFMYQDTLAGFLAEAGFAEVSWYGDFDRSSPSPNSPEIIAVASAP